MTPITRLLFEFIKQNVNSNNQLNLSNEEISGKLEVNKSSVSRCVKLLKLEGLISTAYDDDLRRTITAL